MVELDSGIFKKSSPEDTLIDFFFNSECLPNPGFWEPVLK